MIPPREDQYCDLVEAWADCRTGYRLPDALLSALEAGDLEAVRVRLDELGDPNVVNQLGLTDSNLLWGSLFDAPEPARMPLARLLIAAGADLSDSGSDGVSPLWIAHLWGPDEVFELLLCHGAALNVICAAETSPMTLLDFVEQGIGGARNAADTQRLKALHSRLVRLGARTACDLLCA